MDTHHSYQRSSDKTLLFMSIGLLLFGALYYALARVPLVPPLLAQLGLTYNASALFVAGGSIPSFVHAAACFLTLTYSLAHAQSFRLKAAYWFGVLMGLLALEAFLGTTTLADVVAVLMGLDVALLIVSNQQQRTNAINIVNANANANARTNTNTNTNNSTGLRPFYVLLRRRTMRFLPALAVGVYASLGVASYGYDGYAECARRDDNGFCVERVLRASPVYMSYNNLRSSVELKQARPMDDVGRIYAFQDFLFINERNRGIHVVNNMDPFNPTPISFIQLPGNLDIEIRGDRLYADSFVDLVTLDISNPIEISEIDRQVDVFAWDAYQNMPYNVRLESSEVDRNLGVVIAYEVNQ